jgi:hypothetical protein
MHSATLFLAQNLGLSNPETASVWISSFRSYTHGFLQSNLHVLDPDYGQILARVRLTRVHWLTKWFWTQEPEAEAAWLQEEYATAFVLRVLGCTSLGRRCVDEAVYEVHRRLCVLQSVWLENGVWVEDRQLQSELKRALTIATQEVELSPAAC